MNFVLKYTVFLLSAVVLLTACGDKAVSVASTDNIVNGYPYWYWDSSYDGRVGGVGEAGFHVQGTSAQRQLAIARAIDEIALQKGVAVSTVQELKQQVSDGAAHSQMNTYSVHTTDGLVLNMRLKEIWQKPGSDVLIAWVVEE